MKKMKKLRIEIIKVKQKRIENLRTTQPRKFKPGGKNVCNNQNFAY